MVSTFKCSVAHPHHSTAESTITCPRQRIQVRDSSASDCNQGQEGFAIRRECLPAPSQPTHRSCHRALATTDPTAAIQELASYAYRSLHHRDLNTGNLLIEVGTVETLVLIDHGNMRAALGQRGSPRLLCNVESVLDSRGGGVPRTLLVGWLRLELAGILEAAAHRIHGWPIGYGFDRPLSFEPLLPVRPNSSRRYSTSIQPLRGELVC